MRVILNEFRFAWNRRRHRKNSLLQAPRSSQRQTAQNIPSKPPPSRLPPTKPSSPSASLLVARFIQIAG